jgi:uncharacterized membrane protein YqiK
MLGNIASILLVVIVIAAILWLIVRLYSRAYIKTTAATAFVRTGGLRRARSVEPLVVVNGAAWVFGFIHRLKWVSLESVAVQVRKTEDDALVTLDPQYMDFEARFFVKVGGDPSTIAIAARTIGGDAVDADAIRRIVDPKVQGAVRDVANSFEMKQLMEKRREFVAQLKERLREDLAENGLVLESVSILVLRPKTQGEIATDDVLGAQVAKANAALIELALTEKNQIEKQAALERARQDAEAERERMGIEELVEKERAERLKNISLVRVTEEAAARVLQEAKREEAERARLITDRALQEARIENERKEALLRDQAQKSLDVERIQRDQELAIAEEERQITVAEATIKRLAAEQKRIEADKLKEQTQQEALAIIEKLTAEREAEIAYLTAQLEARQQALEIQTHLEREATQQQETAALERSVATVQAEVVRIRAEAELEAAKLAALGERERHSAAGMAEVQVALERVKVLQREADALRQKLIAEADGEKARAEALSSHDGLGQQLELAELSAKTLKDIEVARARALGEAIRGMKMNLYGDSDMAHQMLGLITAAQSVGQMYEALPQGGRSVIEGLARRLGIVGEADARGATSNAAAANGQPAAISLKHALETLSDLAAEHAPEMLEEQPQVGAVAERLLALPSLSAERRAVLLNLLETEALTGLTIDAALSIADQWQG